MKQQDLKSGNKLMVKVDGFVCASGTGGTIGGVSKFLKEKNKRLKFIYLIQQVLLFIIIFKMVN